MGSLGQAATKYRLIITRRNISEILLLPNGSGWVLPTVETHPQQRLAEQLTAETSRCLGLGAYCLFVPAIRSNNANKESSCAVMESVEDNGKPPTGAYWMPCSVATSCCDSPDAGPIGESLAQLDSCVKARDAGAFAQPGWLRELFLWVQEQVAPQGLRLNGRFRQLSASPTCSLIRLETDKAAVWFKATGKPNSHELSVTVALARLFPSYIPQILGIHRAWNGWVSAEATGTSLDEAVSFSAWERTAEALAALQVASIGKTTELLEAQSKDLRVPRLLERIGPFVARMGKLMAAQKESPPMPLDPSELTVLAQTLKESCALLESLKLPDTIGHMDFNPGNIIVSEDQCVFLDWSEACVTNPLLTFEYLFQHLARTQIAKSEGREQVAAAYLRPWARFNSSAELARAVEIAPLVAVFAYAMASGSWSSADPVSEPKVAGYYRSLTRRMYREAIQITPRSEPCVH